MARKATILKTIGICANAIGEVGNNNPNPLKKRERTDDGGDLGGSDPPSSRGAWGRSFTWFTWRGITTWFFACSSLFRTSRAQKLRTCLFSKHVSSGKYLLT
eukprot:1186136-Prorocentrum_minimum.AAC.1